MNNSEDLCGICYLPNDNTNYVLKCNHKFHYECLLNSIKFSNNYNKSSSNKYNKICPYCRTPINYIDLRPGYSFIKNIHKPISHNIKCKAILKSGKNKGQICGCSVKYGEYCGRHYKSATKQCISIDSNINNVSNIINQI